jgi:hypothetical protein
MPAASRFSRPALALTIPRRHNGEMPTEPLSEPVAQGPPTAAHSSTPISPVPFLLGAFIVGNVLFLLCINVLGFFKDLGWLLDSEGATWKVVSHLALDLPEDRPSHANDLLRLSRRWGDVTGQTQSWMLFAPGIGDSASFAEVELRWDDAPPGHAGAGSIPPVRLSSENLPANMASYLRWGNSRQRKYETNVVVRVVLYSDETEATARKRWARSIRQRFRDQWDTIQAYLTWRLRKHREAHPSQAAPRQVILFSRCYFIPGPEQQPWNWQGPFTVPVARLRPGKDARVEMYDLLAANFVPRNRAFSQ